MADLPGNLEDLSTAHALLVSTPPEAIGPSVHSLTSAHLKAGRAIAMARLGWKQEAAALASQIELLLTSIHDPRYRNIADGHLVGAKVLPERILMGVYDPAD